MDVPNFLQIYQDILTCKYDKSSQHPLLDPRILPCGSTACFECIQQTTNTNGIIKCSMCNQVHKIASWDELPENLGVKKLIKSNENTTGGVLARKFKEELKQVKGDKRCAFKLRYIDEMLFF